MNTQESPLNASYNRDQIIAALTQLDAILPGQAPLLQFVHHNTLHGFQHLPFEQALAEFEALTGISAYLPEQQSRLFYHQNRINDDDLNTALAKDPNLQPDQVICQLGERVITRKELYKIALLFNLDGISISQLNWNTNELNALKTLQADVPTVVCEQLVSDDHLQNTVIEQLWECILNKLDLQQAVLHPETLLDLNLDQAEKWLATYQTLVSVQAPLTDIQSTEFSALDDLFSQLGDKITLRTLILKLSGVDILDAIRPQLIRICATVLDEGIAAWPIPERNELGFYGAWRANINYDVNPFLHELPDWQQIINELPEDAIDTIILQLTQLEIPKNHWIGYLRRLTLELPGWSGLINWRQHHPHYITNKDASPKLVDYLAIRLTLDRLWLNQICMDIWKTSAKTSSLRAYFRKNLAEFTVRRYLYQGDLPEYLTQLAESLTLSADPDRQNRADWQQLADLIWTWQCSPMAEQNREHTAHNSGWRLFRLCQHLGLTASQLQTATKDDVLALLNVLDDFNVTERSKIWLYAYEINYRNSLFQALRANHHRGRWAKREHRPDAQLIFCMDDREESFRRHLEEFNPNIETLGAAGFFGIAMNYQGLNDDKLTPLCPVVVTPAHNIHEVPQTTNAQTLSHYRRTRKIKQGLANSLHNGLRRNLFLSNLIINAIAPLSLIGTLTKTLLPRRQHQLFSSLSRGITPSFPTQLNITAGKDSRGASPERPQQGFTTIEQANRVAGFLKNVGLTSGFSNLVVLMGHGSISQNNPHLAAYDCGACGGQHGGPNARAFAAMANRHEVRQLLFEQGITIPKDTWFIGAEHNTCSEAITWYDLPDIPSEQLPRFDLLKQALRHTQQLSAHERCRRLASAPKNPTPQEALAHIEERSVDFSQARPELGHATNAAALVGRRSLTQGAFFDRRLFLISYDPTQDPDGKILEGILLAIGPVGAGINLEYYFSTVNNERFGCGSKVPHNITGFFGVMEGASSDLRTGLPQQMVEIHEAMRLQLIVEAKTSVLERIYTEQASLRELISGGWLHLSAKDPDSDELFIFEPNTGFVRWQAAHKIIQTYDSSPSYYQNQTLPIAPMLIKQPEPRTRRSFKDE